MSKRKSTKTLRPRGSLEKRFWVKVGSPDSHGCWPWLASTNKAGYGKIGEGGRSRRTLLAHRVSWGLVNGPVQEDLCVLHTCDNPKCVNPKHLFLGTKKDNSQDMMRKGRAARGDRNGSRLHPEVVPRGDHHWSRRNPEKVSRGDRHYSRKSPEKVRRGDGHWTRIHKDRLPHGEKSSFARLTWSLVRKIRKEHLEGRTQRSLEQKYQVSKNTIYRVVHNEAWKEA